MHERCWELFQHEIVGGVNTMAIAPQVLTEFAHVVTNPRRFEQPLPMSEALLLCEQWWSAHECSQAIADDEAARLFTVWMTEHRLGRKQLLDTMLAATYHRAGAARLATSNWRDFTRYGVFEVERV